MRRGAPTPPRVRCGAIRGLSPRRGRRLRHRRAIAPADMESEGGQTLSNLCSIDHHTQLTIVAPPSTFRGNPGRAFETTSLPIALLPVLREVGGNRKRIVAELTVRVRRADLSLGEKDGHARRTALSGRPPIAHAQYQFTIRSLKCGTTNRTDLGSIERSGRRPNVPCHESAQREDRRTRRHPSGTRLRHLNRR